MLSPGVPSMGSLFSWCRVRRGSAVRWGTNPAEPRQKLQTTCKHCKTLRTPTSQPLLTFTLTMPIAAFSTYGSALEQHEAAGVAAGNVRSRLH